MIKNKPGCVVPYSFPAASAFSLPNVGRCDPHNHRNLPLISFLYIQGWPEVLYLQNKQKRLENVPVLSKEPIVPANKSTSIPRSLYEFDQLYAGTEDTETLNQP